MRTIARAMMLVVVLSIPLAAQSTLTGKWVGETPNGFDIALELTVNETTLTGTMTRGGRSTPIADGKVSKNSFTFQVPMNGQAEGASGELDGDEIRLWMDRQGRENAIVLKRAK